GACMAESHVSMKHDYEISCRELDIMVDLANARDGLIGARMTGGGFGGCTINLVRTTAVDRFKTEMQSAYHQATGISPEIYVSHAGGGATKIPTDGYRRTRFRRKQTAPPPLQSAAARMGPGFAASHPAALARPSRSRRHKK